MEDDLSASGQARNHVSSSLNHHFNLLVGPDRNNSVKNKFDQAIEHLKDCKRESCANSEKVIQAIDQLWFEIHGTYPIFISVLNGTKKKIEQCTPESQNAINIADDSISLVFGKETQGKVCGLGFGVTPSKVGTCVQQNGTIKQLQSMMHNLQQDMHEMRSMFFQNMKQQNEQEQVVSGGASEIGNDIGCDYAINRPQKNGNVDNVDQHKFAMQTNLKNMSCGDILENTKCKLLHWCGDGVVAEGRIASTDPKEKVHHVPLGGSCWKV